MGESMTPKITVATEHLAAGIAFIRFMVGVGEEMSLQIGSLVETSTADRAFVGRFF